LLLLSLADVAATLASNTVDFKDSEMHFSLSYSIKVMINILNAWAYMRFASFRGVKYNAF